MNKTLAKTIAMFLLMLPMGACSLAPAKQPEPLVLPYLLHEQEFEGNRLTVTLQDFLDGPSPYCFHMAARTAEGETRFGVYIIAVVLTDGYQKGMRVDWNELIGKQKGSGGLWEGQGLDATDLTSVVAYGLDATADHPVAVFVRVVATSRADPTITREEMQGPVAILQILPDGQGVVRLDP